jgi:hypothetical protein
MWVGFMCLKTQVLPGSESGSELQGFLTGRVGLFVLLSDLSALREGPYYTSFVK